TSSPPPSGSRRSARFSNRSPPPSSPIPSRSTRTGRASAVEERFEEAGPVDRPVERAIAGRAPGQPLPQPFHLQQRADGGIGKGHGEQDLDEAPDQRLGGIVEHGEVAMIEGLGPRDHDGPYRRESGFACEPEAVGARDRNSV